MARYRIKPALGGWSIKKELAPNHWWPASFADSVDEAESRIKSWQEHDKQPTKYYD